MRGPLVETLNGNRYIGLAVCALTKYTESAGKNMHNLNLMEIEFSNFRFFEFSNFRFFEFSIFFKHAFPPYKSYKIVTFYARFLIG